MSDSVRVELFPLGRILQARRGSALQDLLFEHGVEFPCGGHGTCKGCKVKVLSGIAPPTDADRQRLSAAELGKGWRLACQIRPTTELKIELGQWELPVLVDNSEFAFTPREGLGVAVDIGTTTIAAQLLDLSTAQVLGVRTALNAQARHGADIMSRVQFAVTESGQPQLQQEIREQIGGLIQEMLSTSSTAKTLNPQLTTVVLVGNTVMHHLFSGLTVEPLSRFPFEPADPGLQCFTPGELQWSLPEGAEIRFLPCLGGFVGSDILAGLLATRLHESDSLQALIDLGTNGEIVIGNRERLLCASTAAGPAFEGARISMGMRAAAGAISEVSVNGTGLDCHVIGGREPRGICGSGLVDAVAAGLQLGRIRGNGRLAQDESFPLRGGVSLNQWDIRELQLAKGAIAAGYHLLLQQWGASIGDLKRVFLAGAFGNYINQASANRIGLLDFPQEKVVPAGNTALLGAKLALFAQDAEAYAYQDLLRKTTHVSLHEDPSFQERYVEQMAFPPG